MMKKLLFLNACVNRETSRTCRIGRALVELLGGNGDYEVAERILEQEYIQPLTSEKLNERLELLKNEDYANERFAYANQFRDADTIVIAAPHWDCGFPAILKTYLEAIGVIGIVYRYGEDGRTIGLCRAERMYYVTTRGGYIGDENDLGFAAIARFGSYCGIKEIKCIGADGFDIEADPEKIVRKTIEELPARL